MAKIEAPNRGFTGVGPGGVEFTDGVGHTDDEGALNYYRGAGYTVDGQVPDGGVPDNDVVDARDAAEVTVGTRLRDAAVDPQPTDFLPPIGAGEGDPHGPQVIAPEVHASGPAGVRPGDVYVDDLGKQEARESEYARLRLAEQVPAGEAVAAEVPDLEERGELGLSDPGSVGAAGDAGSETTQADVAAQADNQADSADSADRGDVGDAERPGRGDPKAAWVDYAVTRGADRDTAEQSTKAELVDRYGG